ncbi:nucleotidyltransferase domain-containing protein [Nocardioides marmorisolisilvae]|uniref:Toxin-antitoxin system toxin subunit n=1 Tax=Nocardioides marmorisolisilvae TaxID=1542737 RepID=A0A3N0DZW5_9ACTN|nr:nucleotidyltransferase domain-containing protein [Nocardioides marmorisolisilvae]RNL81142.1 toxin-antitoxin system toxin subunit [Nocardioides marmorisolisilvae]
MEGLSEVARRCDDAIESARAELVAAVRQAAANGMTQSQIAAQIGRSQPEVSRLLHFHGNSPRALALRRVRRQVIALVEAAGGSDVRVFGSVASGEDGENSDIDLLFSMGRRLSLIDISRLEHDITVAVGYEVDLIPDQDLIPPIKERVLAAAVSL